MASQVPPISASGVNLVGFAWLSVGAAVATILLKGVAYHLTGSVGLLSDALESVVNLAGAVGAVVALRIAARPADEEHPYGHEKFEYFSSGLEGALVFVAAVAILISALPRLWSPTPLESVGVGLAVSSVASLINLAMARVLLAAGRRHRSVALEADGHHLMTDVWTSVGVIIGVTLVAITDLPILDPIVAILVALNILWTGYQLLYRSGMGLLDSALPRDERDAIDKVLDRYRIERGVEFHALRTRQAGARRFVTMHLLVPGQWTVQAGHDLSEEIERDLRALAAKTTILTHIEPMEDDTSFRDQGLDRQSDPPPSV